MTEIKWESDNNQTIRYIEDHAQTGGSGSGLKLEVQSSGQVNGKKDQILVDSTQFINREYSFFL